MSKRERVRFTAWLSRTERDLLAKYAAEHECSENFVMRLAVRQFFGLPNPAHEKPETAEAQTEQV